MRMLTPLLWLLLAVVLLLGAGLVWAEGMMGREWTRIWGGETAMFFQDNLGVALDGEGNVYAVGHTDAVSFDGQTNAGVTDICLSKFDPDGARIWTRFLGGPLGDGSYCDVAVDTSNYVYVAGDTSGDFGGEMGPGGICLARLDPSGSQIWARIFGTTGDRGLSVTVDMSNDVYIAGKAYSAFGGQTNAGGSDSFLLKSDCTGSQVWARIWGSPVTDIGYAVAVDKSNCVYVAGETGGAFDGQTNTGGADVCLTKFDSSGARIWTRIWGSPTNDHGRAVAVDRSNDVYVGGFSHGEIDGQPNAGGTADMFVTKFAEEGSRLWTRTWGSLVGDVVKGLAVDEPDYAYAAGYAVSNGGGVALVAMTPTGVVWNCLWGHGYAADVALSPSGHLVVAGTASSDFDGETCPGNQGLFLSRWHTAYVPVLSAAAIDSSTITVAWPGAWNCEFDVEFTTNLLNTNAWVTVSGCTNMAGAEHMAITNTVDMPVRCYRVRARESE